MVVVCVEGAPRGPAPKGCFSTCEGAELGLPPHSYVPAHSMDRAWATLLRAPAVLLVADLVVVEEGVVVGAAVAEVELVSVEVEELEHVVVDQVGGELAVVVVDVLELGDVVVAEVVRDVVDVVQVLLQRYISIVMPRVIFCNVRHFLQRTAGALPEPSHVL